MNRERASAADSLAPQDSLRTAAQLVQAGRYAAAEPMLEAVLAQTPRQPDALHLLGIVAHRAGQQRRALELVGNALAIQENPVYFNTFGGIQRALDQAAPAVESFRRALALAPDFAVAHNNLGLVLHALGNLAEAEAAFRRALEIEPRYAAAAASLGAVLFDAARPNDAAEALSGAVALGLADRGTRLLLARALIRAERHGDAIAALGPVIEINPGDREADELLLECRSMTCDWSAPDALAQHIRRKIAAGVADFAFENIFFGGVRGLTRADHLAIARAAAARIQTQAGAPPERAFPRTTKAKLRLGYLSGSVREHPIAALIAELLELHDRSRFEVFGYSTGPGDDSELRRRVVGALDRFADLRGLTSRAAADRIATDGIDVLVDLTGYGPYGAPRLLALRPAPVQASFLGTPATMGADFIDYVVADRFVLPPEHAGDYAEAPAYLPHCYMPRDRKRDSAPAPSRAACGLPETALVFCCFNRSGTITPDLFALWMGLLQEIPGSVLWLRDAEASATRNLRAAAATHMLEDRLVFAPRAGYPQHLARLGCADLALDTLACDAEATANDALWAGVPLLTCVGDTFAARVGGSLLSAAGLPELITTSLDEYRALALRLAGDPAVLRGLREKLAAARGSSALFDTTRFARDLEALYARMWDRFAAGEKPATLDLAQRRP